MQRFVFQYSDNPFVRILIGVASLAIFAGLAFLMLPVVLAIIAAAIVLGLLAWGWAWYQSKKMGGTDPWAEQMRQAMNRANSRGMDANGEATVSRQENTLVRVETSDKKQWKMNDVEDIEERK